MPGIQTIMGRLNLIRGTPLDFIKHNPGILAAAMVLGLLGFLLL